MNTKQILLIFLFVIVMTSCKTSSRLQENKPELPSRYGVVSKSDSSNSAQIKWGDFIADTALVQLIKIGLTNNPDLLIAYQRLEMARSDNRFAKGALLPSVSLGTEAAQRKWGRYTMDGAGNSSTYIRGDEIVPEHLRDYFVGFRATWEVDIWGKLRAKKAAAVARYLATVEGRNFVYTNLIAELASAYFEIVALDNELVIVENNIALQERALRMVLIQKESGAANDLAVRQMEAQLLNTQGLAIQVRQHIIATENRINLLLGRMPEPLKRNASLFDSTSAPKLFIGAPSELLIHRPDIRQAEYQLQATKADVRSARALFLPSLSINGMYGFQAYKPSLLLLSPESVAYGLVGGLFTPILNRSALKANFAYANATQLEALYTYQRSIINAYTEVSTLYSELELVRKQAEIKQREVEVLDRSVSVSDELFRTGRATYLEVIMAQRDALHAKRDLIQLKKLKHITAVNLYKALGGGVPLQR